jgi:hypothetical protein
MRGEDHNVQREKKTLQPQEDIVLYLDDELHPFQKTKNHVLLTVLRPNRMMKEIHLKEVQEVLLRIHRPLTHQHLHRLLRQQPHFQLSLHQQSQIKNHTSRNQTTLTTQSNGVVINDKPSFISRKTKKILLVAKALSGFSSVS